ncbi:MAG: hypothetical protein SGARI_000923, partial [Bacillariaceae sp.]
DPLVAAVVEESLASAASNVDEASCNASTAHRTSPSSDPEDPLADALIKESLVSATFVEEDAAQAKNSVQQSVKNDSSAAVVEPAVVEQEPDFFKLDAFLCDETNFQCLGPFPKDDAEVDNDKDGEVLINREIKKTVTWDCPDDDDHSFHSGFGRSLESLDDDEHTLESLEDDPKYSDSLLYAMEEAADELFFQDFVASQSLKAVQKEPWSDLIFATQATSFDDSISLEIDEDEADDASEESSIDGSPQIPPLSEEEGVEFEAACVRKLHFTDTVTSPTVCTSFSSVSFESLEVFPTPGGFEITFGDDSHSGIEQSLLQHVTSSLVERRESFKKECHEKAVASEKYLLQATPWLDTMFSEDDDELSCEESCIEIERKTTHQYLYATGDAVTSDNWSLEDEPEELYATGPAFDTFCHHPSSIHDDQDVVFGGVEVVGIAHFVNGTAEV